MSDTDLVVPEPPAPALAPALPLAVSAAPDLPPPLESSLGRPLSPLPLPARHWGAAQALEALAEARLSLPVHLPGATVVSALSTVVLRSGDYAVKVYPPGTDPTHLDQITRALTGTSTAYLPLHRAVVTSHGTVTLTPWLHPARPVTWPETGGLLRRFHIEHADAPVAPWMPLSRVPSQVDGLAAEAAGVLLAARAALLTALGRVRSQLGEGTLHGDVSPSNVLRTPHGPRLIDLDWVARGPREYDLTSASRRFRAGELSRRTYAGFCRAYGSSRSCGCGGRRSNAAWAASAARLRSRRC